MSAKQNMTDKEYMQDILFTLKTLSSLYHYGVQESSTQTVHTTFQNILNASLEMLHCVYKDMEQRGWYQTQQASPQEINQVKTKIASA